MGYALTRTTNNRFDIVNLEHGTMCETDDLLDDEGAYSYDEILELATNKSDPRIPDIATDDVHLLTLYVSILKHKEAILTWNPKDHGLGWTSDCLEYINLPAPIMY